MKAKLMTLQGMPLTYHTGIYIDYIKDIKSRSSNTVVAYLQDLNCFSRFLVSSNSGCSTLDEECITSYLKFIRHVKELKPATVRRRLLTLQGFCEWLVVSNVLEVNPFDDISIDLKVPKRLPRPVDLLTIRQLFMENLSVRNGMMLNPEDWTSSSRASQKHTTLLIIQLMLTTGIRVGEISSIRVTDISSDGKTIHIFGKGNKERLVYIENEQLASALSQYQRERRSIADAHSNLFVNSRGNSLTPQTIRKRVKSMCKEIGASDTPTPHRFRHSAATLLIENGVDIRVVQRLLGHASISTTELYTQVSDVSLRDALRRADVLKQFQ